MAGCGWRSERNVKKNAEVYRIMVKEETRAHIRKITEILKKSHENWTDDDRQLLAQSEDVVERVKKRARLKELAKMRHLEIEDDSRELQAKCRQLASAIRKARHLVVYTGAGISTAASIPDYRGPNGVWTMLRQGKLVRTKDLSDAEPTYTHMSITELYRHGYIQRVVSQNCDGLHLRSGLPSSALSELHGNMYIEMCKQCRPNRQYIRLCDITERTGVRRHKTGRRCHKCRAELYDTIVHFGEKGGYQAPYNWKRAARAADHADMILCLGSSLKVLKKYPCLWGMHKPASKRPRLYIVNLQWTPKDDTAALKINGKCDDVLHLVMDYLALEVPQYTRELDPIFALSTAFRKHEQNSVNKKILVRPANYDCAHVEQLLRHTVQSARNSRLASSAEIAPHLLAAIERTDDFEELEKSKRPRKSSIEDDDCNLPGNSTKSFEENPVSATIEEGLFQDLPGEFVRQRIADCTSATNAEPFCWTPAASNGVQPVGVPPWYLNGIRLGGVGPPQVPTVGGALLFPAKTHTDLWWNSVDSQTWLMGLQNYLLLHSLSGLGLRLQWIRPPPSLALNGLSSVGAGWPNTCTIGPRFVSNAAASQFAPPQPSSLPMGCSFADVCNAPNQSPTVGSSAPAADLNVPGVYLRKRESPTVDKSSPGEVDRSSRRSHHSVINLVNFMHNYCIPQSQVAAATSSLPVDCRVSPSGGSDRELVVDGQSSNYGQTSPCSGIDVGFSKEIRPVRKCCPSSSADASSVSGLRLNLSPAAAANSSAAAPSACHGGDPVESDSDSAVACTTGSGSSLRSTPSASSTLTENWLDDCSSSQSPSSTDAAYGPAPVATARKSIDSAVEIASAAAIDDEDEMTTPGWFGKGVGMKRLKKRRYRRDSR